jgi:hypothetical protein
MAARARGVAEDQGMALSKRQPDSSRSDTSGQRRKVPLCGLDGQRLGKRRSLVRCQLHGAQNTVIQQLNAKARRPVQP